MTFLAGVPRVPRPRRSRLPASFLPKEAVGAGPPQQRVDRATRHGSSQPERLPARTERLQRRRWENIYIGQEVEGQEQLGERDKDAGEPWTSCPSCRKDDEDGLKLRVKRVFPWSTSCLFMCDDSFRCFLVNWDISLSCNSSIPCATSIIIPTRTEVYIQAKKCSTTFSKLVIHSISCSSASTLQHAHFPLLAPGNQRSGLLWK